MARGDPQINIRLSPERFEIVDAAAFVKRKGSATQLAREEIQRLIDGWAEEQAVKTVLRARQEEDAAQAGKLTPIRGKRRKSKSGD